MNEILYKLINKGFSAYVVGGYVRDKLLNISSFDIDICTNANLDNIIKLIGKGGKSYKEYLSYHISDNTYNYDITSFRKEIEYKNNKPIKMYGVDDLYTDLLRRDFTINTLALDINNNLIDLLNAKKDLDDKLIKVVGDTYEKLTEDKTRIVRAIRFYSILNFELDNEIVEFIKEKPHFISELNNEYLYSELNIIFKTNPIRFINFINKYNLRKYFNINYNNIILTPDYYGIWAQVDNDFNIKKEDKLIINSIKKLVKKGSINQYDIYLYGEIVCKNSASILNINIDNIIKSMPIHSILDINITREELLSIVGIKSINNVYKFIEKNILINNIKNNNYDIINYIRSNYHE